MNKSLNWYFTRHPLLYKMRYRMLLKQVPKQRLEAEEFSLLNKKEDMPEVFFVENENIFPHGRNGMTDHETTKHIAHWLRTNVKVGPGLGTYSEKTLHELINGNGGVCSDISQVFNIFCIINHIRVREWGVYHPEKVTLGHSFNEFYDHDLKKWILIDPSESIIFYDKESNTPLSVEEVFEQTEDIGTRIEHRYFFPRENQPADKIHSIYYSEHTIPFVLANYSNKVYDRFAKRFNFLPISIVHGLMLLTGKSYRYYTAHPI